MDTATVLSGTYSTLETTDATITLSMKSKEKLMETGVNLQLDLYTERVITERTIEDGLELRFWLGSLYLCTSFLGHLMKVDMILYLF